MLAVEKRLNQEKGLLEKNLTQNLNAFTSPHRPQGSQGYQGGQGRGGGGYGRGGGYQGGRGQGQAWSGGNQGGQGRGDAPKPTEGRKKRRWQRKEKGGGGRGEGKDGKHVRFNACVVEIEDDKPPKAPKLAGAFPAQGQASGYHPDPSRLRQVAPNTWVEE